MSVITRRFLAVEREPGVFGRALLSGLLVGPPRGRETLVANDGRDTEKL